VYQGLRDARTSRRPRCAVKEAASTVREATRITGGGVHMLPARARGALRRRAGLPSTTTPASAPDAHAFIIDKAPWFAVTDDLP
jgi:hypothetical protein